MAKKDMTWLLLAVGGLFAVLGWSLTNTAKSIARLPIMLADSVIDALNHILAHLKPGGKP